MDARQPGLEQSSGYLQCVPPRGWGFDELLPSIDFAEAFIDQTAPPPAGGVQLVRIQWWATGGDDCREQGGSGTLIEIIPLPGVELALGPENPALCGFSIILDAAACPVLSAPGSFGGTLLQDGRSGPARPWPVSDGLNKTRLIVPVRLTRPISTFASSAERRCGAGNAGPCPPDQSNGRVQFAIRFIPGPGASPSAPLVSTVGLVGGRSLLARRPPSRVRRSTLRRGLTLRVNAPAGATATATLNVGSRTLARARRRAGTSGTASVRLRATARALRRLGTRARRARLTVAVASRRQTFTLRIVR